MEPKPKTEPTTNAVPAHRAKVIDARCYFSTYYSQCVPPVECTYCPVHLDKLKRKAKSAAPKSKRGKSKRGTKLWHALKAKGGLNL